MRGGRRGRNGRGLCQTKEFNKKFFFSLFFKLNDSGNQVDGDRSKSYFSKEEAKVEIPGGGRRKEQERQTGICPEREGEAVMTKEKSHTIILD